MAGSASLAALAACGGRKASTSGSASGKPQYGGQLHVPIASDPSGYDPTGAGGGKSGLILQLAYESLIHVKSGPGIKYTDKVLEPALATSWESPDPQTFIFHLDKGAKFADLPPVLGRQVTSTDVKWSFEYESRTGPFQGNKKLGKAMYSWVYEGLDSIETPDSGTATVRFDAPMAPFLQHMASPYDQYAPILAHEVYDQDGDFNTHLVGTGPWQLDESASQRGTIWVMKKNPTYFRSGRPYIDQINLLILPDDASQFAAFSAKQIDMVGLDTPNIDPSTADQLSKNNPHAIKLQFPNLLGGYLYENVRKAPLGDLRVRKALALCVDRDEMLKTFSAGQGEWVAAGSPPGLFTQEELKKMLAPDPAQARQLLSQAGYPDGVQIELINPGTARGGQQEVNKMQLLQAQAKRGGIDLVYHPVDLATETQRRNTGNFQTDYIPKPSNDIDEYLVSTFYSKSAGNYDGIDDPKLDQLVLAQRSQIDPTKWNEAVRQAALYVNDQAYGFGFIYTIRYEFAQPYVHNYAQAPLQANGLYAVDTWLAK